MATVPYQLPRILIAIMLLAAISSPAFAAQRVALVVGNNAYAHTTPLRNPKHDADDMAEKLEALKFEVIKGIDLDRNGFFRKLAEFNRAAREADVALFFYAGHGLQAFGENYLVPIDARVEEEVDLHGAVELNDILRYMRSPKNLVFLDACRDNPMVESLERSLGTSRSGAVSRGLKRVEPELTDESWTLISFATAEGDTADDGPGRNSPYTKALLEHIDAPAINVEEMLNRVANTVWNDTKKKQRPWKSGSILETNFFFNPKAPAEEAYEQAVLTGTVAALEKVIEDHPESEFAEEARKRKEKLQAGEQPAQIAQAIQSAVTQGATQGERIVNERVFFDFALESRDPMNLQAYLDKYPKGEFAPLARNELRKLIIKISDPSELQAFLNMYPDSQFAGLARLRLKRSIENSTDSEALEIYLESFPDSEFVEQARGRLKQLDASSSGASGGEAPEPAVPEPAELEPQEASPEPALSGPTPEQVEWSLELERAERRRIQQGLAAEGFDPGWVDGRFGPDTRSAIERWQESRGKPKTRHLDAESVKILLAAADEADARQAAAEAKAQAERQAAEAKAQAERQAAEAKAQAERQAAEDKLWNSVKNSKDPADFDRYLTAYPQGRYAKQALRLKAELLEARRAEDQLWNSVKNSENPADLDRYLTAYPQGRYAKQALRLKAELLEVRRAEDQLWNSVKNSENPADFDRYLTAYPQGRYAKQALRLKAELLEARRAEDKLWNSIKNSRDPADFARYLKAYPEGKYAVQARMRRAELNKAKEERQKAEKALWLSIRGSRNPADFDEYLEAYPNGRYRNGARQRRDQLIAADRAAYQSAQSAGTVQSLEKYLRDHPHGRYRSDARARLKELRKAQEERPPAPKSSFRDCDACPEMVVLPRLGSKLIAVGRYEVTFDEWEACRRAESCPHNPSDRGWGRGKRPVINVNWHDTQRYLHWLSRTTGKKYRLLKDLEWKHASLGKQATGSRESFRSSPVGSSTANAHGLHDMAGNVWEWLDSCAQTGNAAEYNFPLPCSRHQLRGGVPGNSVSYKRTRNLNRSPPTTRHDDVGFRVATRLE